MSSYAAVEEGGTRLPPTRYGACEGSGVKVVRVTPSKSAMAQVPAIFPRARAGWPFHARRG